jgi:hypothetical protein
MKIDAPYLSKTMHVLVRGQARVGLKSIRPDHHPQTLSELSASVSSRWCEVNDL